MPAELPDHSERLTKQRENDGEDVWGPNEVMERRISLREMLVVRNRPSYMLITEPIVAWLWAVGEFSDDLMLIFLQDSQAVYKQWALVSSASLWRSYRECFRTQYTPLCMQAPLLTILLSPI